MQYTSVAQILEEIDETRGRLCRRVEGLSDEQANTRKDQAAWSPAEILEHLALIENRLLRMMSMMLTKAEGGGFRSDGDPIEMKSFSLDELIEGARGTKFTAPEAVTPS